MTNANFTFLIFFHKTPLSKGRLDYQSPFPFCKAATTLHYPYGIVNFAVTLNSKIHARAFLWGTRTPPVSRECILLSLTVASVLKRKRSRRGKLGRGFCILPVTANLQRAYFTLAYRCECSQAKAVPKGKARAGFCILPVTANLISFCLVSCKVLCYDRTQYTERNR